MGTAAPGVEADREEDLAMETALERSQRPSTRPTTARESRARTGEPLSPSVTGWLRRKTSAAGADVFLLSHPVTLGESGSPVLALDSRAVVGLVEGRWLRSSAVSIAKSSSLSASTPGAAVPIRCAIALLQRHAISWHAPHSPPSSSATR